jgi:C4-dicarboxylate transporter DctM subunit
VVSIRKGLGKTAMEKFNVSEFLSSAKSAFLPFMIIVILFVGIYTGAFTITEASVVSCVLAILLEVGIYRAVGFTKLHALIVSAALMSGTLIITVSGAGVLSEYITIQGIPGQILDFSMQYLPNYIIFLIFTDLLLLLVGTFLDPIGAIMILVPILLPIATQFGIDATHYCLIITVALGIGYITPPLGLLLYTASAVTKRDFLYVARAIMPTLGIYVVSLFLITFIPWISMVVPDLLFR